MKRYIEYFKYLLRHKFKLFTVGFVMNIPIWTLIKHDMSKFLPSEFFDCAKTFYYENGGSTYNPTANFEKAWLFHQNRNRHHWNYWVSTSDDGTLTPVFMENQYVREMVADWITMGFTVPGALSPAQYYLKIRDTLIMHPDSQYFAEVLLNQYADLQTSDMRAKCTCSCGSGNDCHCGTNSAFGESD